MAVAPEQIDHRGTGALEMHDLEIDVGHHLEELGRHMRGGADARSYKNQLAGLLLRQCDELFHRVGRNARMDDERDTAALPSLAIGVKDFIGSYGSFWSAGCIVCVPATRSSV